MVVVFVVLVMLVMVVMVVMMVVMVVMVVMVGMRVGELCGGVDVRAAQGVCGLARVGEEDREEECGESRIAARRHAIPAER
jgi:hypothetical protein